ncbi:MAG: hypothetical protein ABEJ87_01575 [Candidatus Nanohalobium sp.]
MSMSLDYLGKLVIVLVVVAVAIGMITTFREQVEDTKPTPGGDQGPGLEIVKISGGHSNAVSKVANLITLCHQRSLNKGFKDLSCFVARKQSGSFSITPSELKAKLETSVENATTFRASTYDRSSIIINYDARPKKVIVKK